MKNRNKIERSSYDYMTGGRNRANSDEADEEFLTGFKKAKRKMLKMKKNTNEMRLEQV